MYQHRVCRFLKAFGEKIGGRWDEEMRGWNFREINTWISWLRSVNTDVMGVIQELEAELAGKTPSDRERSMGWDGTAA